MFDENKTAENVSRPIDAEQFAEKLAIQMITHYDLQEQNQILLHIRKNLCNKRIEMKEAMEKELAFMSQMIGCLAPLDFTSKEG